MGRPGRLKHHSVLALLGEAKLEREANAVTDPVLILSLLPLQYPPAQLSNLPPLCSRVFYLCLKSVLKVARQAGNFGELAPLGSNLQQ